MGPTTPAAGASAAGAGGCGTSPSAMGWPGFGMFNPFMAMMGGWPQALAGKFQGRIKSFNLEKGWGFIECPQTYAIYNRDVFLHKAEVGEMQVGAFVAFSCEAN